MFNPTASVIKTYATAADTDLIADSASSLPGGAGRPTKWIVVGTAGDLVVKTSRGTTATLSLAVGIPVYVEATNIVAAGSGAAKITVGW